MTITILFRPVGLYELQLISDSNFTEFPPRLPEQPIFYPVLNAAYAEQIARDWNTKDAASGFMGAVTQFTLPSEYLKQFKPQTVGQAMHTELWVPADQLTAFNGQIIGNIEVIRAFYGERFDGERMW
jgi:hypothetical protein